MCRSCALATSGRSKVRPPAPASSTSSRRSSAPSGRSNTKVSGSFSTAKSVGIAQKRGDVDGLARAIDAALGVDQRIERTRGVAAFDAAIRQIEARGGENEEAVIAGHGGRQHRGRKTALALRQARIEAHIAVRVGLCGGEHFVVAGDQLQIDAGNRRSASRASGRRRARRRRPRARSDRYRTRRTIAWRWLS